MGVTTEPSRQRRWAAVALGAWIAALFFTELAHASETPAQLDRAREHMEAGELRTVVIELKNLLQEAPEEAEARWLLGRTYLRMGRLEAAEKEFRRAAQYGRPAHEIAYWRGRAILEQGDHARLLEEIAVDDEWPPGVRSRVAAMRAQALIRSGRSVDAESILDAYRDVDPGNIEARLARIQLELVAGRPERAVSLGEDAVDVYPDSERAWTHLARAQVASGALESAEQTLEEAIARAYVPYEQRLLRARIRLSLGAREEALSDIEWLRENAPDHPAVLFSDGLLAWTDEDFEAACSRFGQALANAPEMREARFYVGACHYRDGDYHQAAAHLERVIDGRPAPAVARVLAATYIAQERYDRARSVLRPLLEWSDREDTAALALMAELENAAGNTSEAIEHLRRLAEVHPEDARVRLQLGLGLMRGGDYEQGRAELNEALTVEPALEQAGAMLVLSHIAEGQYEEGLAAAAEMAERAPDAALPWTLRGLVLRASGDVEGAVESLEKAVKRVPGDPSARHVLASIALERREIDAARGEYQAVLDERPEHITTLMRLALLEGRSGNARLADELLHRAHESDPDALEPRLLLARKELGRGDFSAAIEWLEGDDGSVRDEPEALLLAATARLRMGAPSWALEHINRVLKENPDDTRAYVLAARAYGDLKRPDEARKQLDTLLEIDPHNAIGLLVEARARLREGNPSAAQELLERVPENARQHPFYLNTRGELAIREGNSEAAVDFYRRAHDVAGSASSAISLASALHRAARTEEAVRLLEAFIDGHPDAIEANHTLGDLYLAQGRTNDAAGAYKSVIERDPGAVDALNNLAWILRSDSPDEARKYAEQAVALRPGDPRLIDTLGIVLLEAGDPQNAVKRLREAVSLAPEAGVLRFHLARALVATGGREEAREHLRIALEGDSDFAQVDAARALLDAIGTAP